MNRNFSFGIFSFTILAIFTSPAIFAMPGDVDMSFTPPVISSTTTSAASIGATALQTDGKIIIGGSFTNIDGLDRIGIAHLNTNGTLDTTFSSPFASGATDTPSR